MKTSFLICLFSFLAFFGYAEKRSGINAKDLCLEQSPQEREDLKQKIQAHRVAFFTEKLALTPAEAEKFWPLFNTYQNERDRLTSEFVQKTRRRRGSNEPYVFDVSNLSDAEARKLVNDRAKLIDLERKFHNDLTKLFSPQRVLAFYDAERSFQRELINTRHQGEGRAIIIGTDVRSREGRERRGPNN